MFLRSLAVLLQAPVSGSNPPEHNYPILTKPTGCPDALNILCVRIWKEAEKRLWIKKKVLALAR